MAHAANRMVVEGEDDKFAIIQLMGHHTDWPDDKKMAPVWLEAIGGPEDILEDGYIPTKLHESGTKVLGVVFDADVNFEGRWQRVTQICKELFQNVPTEMPKGGLILQNDTDEPKLGIWIMPDNERHGMIETFLQGLIPAHSSSLLAYAETVVNEARKLNAPCRDCHSDKAKLHSWLAWQDPPGQPFGRALTTITLDPDAELAKPFVKWFLGLYDLRANHV